ncbi:sugar-binding transcriptional regulator [Aneurinibacillus terranovensis]|uniref:sugar-binding transcriptional regulator n=1 Tax=Aneurinibacillus terranovensis TaxID=278991 RepID=UPI0003FD01D6|nr:sugar-binding transcriptional regulator [Aneurinibacillus terranovensis]
MAYSDDSRILLKIAHMYYDEGATQQEIAEILGVSRPLISKYLAKARELGIVEIIIHDELAHPYTTLETKLEQKYKLREVIVVPEAGTNGVKRNLGFAAGNYVLRVAKKNQIIGVSSGTTMYEVAQAMPSGSVSVTVIPLVGGTGSERIETHTNQIAAQIADKLGAEYKLLHAPLVVDSAEAKEFFLRQSSIKDIFSLSSRCDIAIVGIGGTPEYSTMVKNYIGEDHLDELIGSGVIGDICYNFINEKGEACNNSWNSRVISLSLNALKEIPIVIGVAYGEEKLKAIHAALVGRLINVLVTDNLTAEKLLED